VILTIVTHIATAIATAIAAMMWCVCSTAQEKSLFLLFKSKPSFYIMSGAVIPNLGKDNWRAYLFITIIIPLGPPVHYLKYCP